MSQILIYTVAAKIGNETRKQLREAGIVPVMVESMDAVRLISAEPPEVSTSVVMRAAMKAITKSTNAQMDFGSLLATELAKETKAEARKGL